MPLKTIDPLFETTYSELRQRSLDASFMSDFPVGGRIVSVPVKGKIYFYYEKQEGGRTYVGPAEDPEIARRVEGFQEMKRDDKARRKLVQSLVRQAYLEAPEKEMGEIVSALGDAGFFRLRGVIVGSAAYGCYAAHLGVRLPGQTLRTGDVDFAQFHSISAAVDDSLPPMLEVLRGVDPSFREVPSLGDGRHCTQYVAGNNFKVEFLTPNTGSDSREGKPVAMPALGGASAFPLRFLDYLIHDPIRAVMLHGAGVPVTVPAPERFAVHKLILASRRRQGGQQDKVRKDVRQAGAIFEAMIQRRMHGDMAMAFSEAWDRGPSWQNAISTGLSLIDDDLRTSVQDALEEGLELNGDDPTDYGFAGPALQNDENRVSVPTP